jgi:hypothetical protein
MACEYCLICKKTLILQRIRDAAGFNAEEYPLTELKKELCDSPDSALRDKDCFAIPDIQANGFNSDWAK